MPADYPSAFIVPSMKRLAALSVGLLIAVIFAAVPAEADAVAKKACGKKGAGQGASASGKKACGKKNGKGKGSAGPEKGTCKVTAGPAKPATFKGVVGFAFPASFHCTGTAKRILYHEGFIRRDPTSPICIERGCTAAWGALSMGYNFPGQVIDNPEEAKSLLKKSWKGEFFGQCEGYATDYGPSWVVQKVDLRSGKSAGNSYFSKPLERAESPEVAVADLCPQL